MKRTMSLLLVLVLLVSLIPVSAQAASKPAVPDLMYYAEDELTFEDEKLSKDVYSRSFRSTDNCYDVLKAYVKLLQDKYDCKLVGAKPYYQAHNGGKTAFFDFCLKYTGSGSAGSKSAVGTFSKEKGHIMIYGTLEKGKVNGAVYYAAGIDRVKGTERYGKADVAAFEIAGIRKDSSGKYMNSDKELKISAGEAKLSLDGKVTTCTAAFRKDRESDQFQVYVRDKSKAEQVKFYFPLNEDLEPDKTFRENYFIVDASYAVKKEGCFPSMPAYNWDTMFAVKHGEDYVIPIRGMGGEMTDLMVKSAYDEKADVMVFYAVARFKTAPYEMKLMVAAKEEGMPDESLKVRAGSTLNIQGPWKESASYELWTWEILEGSANIRLSDAKQRTCTIKGLKKGEARVRVTYEYSVKQADVLTGRPVNWGKSIREEYTIRVN